jgi:hypothetical protein
VSYRPDIPWRYGLRGCEILPSCLSPSYACDSYQVTPSDPYLANCSITLEKTTIHAGEKLWVKGFLKDIYGNPICTAELSARFSASIQVPFTCSAVQDTCLYECFSVFYEVLDLPRKNSQFTLKFFLIVGCHSPFCS